MMIKNKYLRCLNNRRLYLFLLGLTLSVGDLKLILATSIFAGTLLATYQVKYLSWKSYNQYLIRFFTPQNKPLIFSVTSAGTLAIASYIILNIWTEIDNKWLALGIIWQTVFFTVGVGFMSYKLWKKNTIKNKQYSPSFAELIHQLNADTSLQRLHSINQIMELWSNNQLTFSQINEVTEYFILLKDLEIEPIIINKLDKNLQKISSNSVQPLNLSLKVNQNIIRKNSIIINS
ncbi:hypothetical protein [Geminocystis sp. GBBB08]|uniref:hypothetical protein n=1 Tax=Geminocystis sp. GBBB08 TaxID=2604140 RepID=UPI0027E2EC82|nr:hypothetical protein [Geminocystis sp. GBBB08]MBL1208648.1 hypothetical protein [Geminocystis sp. GBBB08]